MSRIAQAACTFMVLALLPGCNSYDGSRFNYQSGGLPFLGMSFAVGHDKNDHDIQVRRADGSTSDYANRSDDTPVLQRIPNMIRSMRAPGSVEIPVGSERSLRDDSYEMQLNEL